MNILFYQHQYPAFGGIETVTTTLANAFVCVGHHVKIVSLIHKEGSGLLGRLESGISWVPLPNSNPEAPENVVAFVEVLKSFRPTVIIFQDSYANIQDLLYKALAGSGSSIRIITVEHNTPERINLRGVQRHGIIGTARGVVKRILGPMFLRKRLVYESLRRQKLIDTSYRYVVLSSRYYSYLEHMVGTSRMSRVCAIANPLVPVSGSEKIGKENIVLFVGSLIRRKGVDRILSIWQRIESLCTGWKLVIVGDGDQRPLLENQAKRLGLKKVDFEGYQPDAQPYFRSASIFVMASDFEGWPMVLGEAMQNGCVPIVYDTFAALHDIIEDGVSGCIIPHFRQDLFISALMSAMQNKSCLERMRANGIIRMQKFEVPNIVREWALILEDKAL